MASSARMRSRRRRAYTSAARGWKGPGSRHFSDERDREEMCMAASGPCLRLALAGDTMLGREVGRAISASRRAPLAPEVVAAAAEAELFVLNLECCVSDRG